MSLSGPGHDCNRDNRGEVVGADPVAEAFRTWMRTCARSGWVGGLDIEVLGVDRAVGRVTAEPVRAACSTPAYRAAAMDGIAVCARDTAGARAWAGIRLTPDQFELVDTGDPVPAGRDAVVMREDIRLTGEGEAVVGAAVTPGRHVRGVGEDIEAGQAVLPAGHSIRPVDAAALAAAGHVSVPVRRRPIVAILPTGDEIRPLGSVLAPGEVLDTNSIMLAGLTSDAGGEARAMPIVPDQPDRIAAAVVEASRRVDLVLVIAGSSAGRDDHTAAVVRRLGAIAAHGVAMRPGHPVLLGVLGGERPVPIVGVPGYPASAERAFVAFVLPMLRRLLGQAQPAVDAVAARLGSAVESAEHLDEYVRVRLARVLDPRTALESLVAIPLSRGAGALDAIIRAEAVVRVPVGHRGFPAGACVWPVPVAGAVFGAGTTLVSGLESPATAALLAADGLGRHGDGTVQWTGTDPDAATDALVGGLCHAAALQLATGEHSPGPDVLAGIVARAGEMTVLEIARTDVAVEVLVVPVVAFDSPAVVRLRTGLRSAAFRRALLECADYSGRNAGRETIHGPAGAASRDPVADACTALSRE
ncbi:MAG TPA: molybdopterin-binding protein [Sporichthyaceae bacterium]|nr:molybdopterin-binding protein [Sporichthyaceae bacterium]